MKVIITESQARKIFTTLSEVDISGLAGKSPVSQLAMLGKLMNIGKGQEGLLNSMSMDDLKGFAKRYYGDETPTKTKASTTTSISGNETLAKRIVNYFVKKGLSPEQASGIAGNLYQESSFNPTIVGDNGTAFGLAQWRGSRLAELRRSTPNWRTIDGQINFIWKELNSTENRTLGMLKTARTPEEAAVIFSKNYERPGIPHNERRMGYAKNIMANYIT